MPNVTKLKPPLTIESILQQLKTPIDALDSELSLNGNAFYSLGADDLAIVLNAIPNHITSLDLSWNLLYRLGADGLIKLLSAIPSHITSLNLAANGLSELGADGLGKLLSAIPSHINKYRNHIKNNPQKKK